MPLRPRAEIPADIVLGESPPDPKRFVLVEEFTADTLTQWEWKIGTELEVGVTDRFDLGTDLVALAVGAPSLTAKLKVLDTADHDVALGVRGAYLDRESVLWGTAKKQFRKLSARVIRPSVAWSNKMSNRLTLHMFWAKGFGDMEAELSAQGLRDLWEAKHPEGDYDSRNEDGEGTDDNDNNTTRNQEKEDPSAPAAFSTRSLQVQRLAGLAQDRFQMTGEFRRQGGNKVLLASRIEQSRLEELKSNLFRLSLSHQWVWRYLQFRIGIGADYYVISGNDLDGEKIDENGVGPAADLVFYWRL